MKRVTKDTCQTKQLITFEVVGRRYGIPKESLMAVLPLESVEASASAGSSQRTGSWRGKTLPIVDARASEQIESQEGRILIAVHGKRGAIGIVADRLQAVVTYELEQIHRIAKSRPSPLGSVSARIVDASGSAIECIDTSALLER